MHKSEKMDFTEMSLKIEIIIMSYSLSFHCVLTPGLCGCVCAHLCPTLCHPMDYSPPGSSVHGISQARILEWVTISTPGDLPDPRIEPVSLMSPVSAGGFFTTPATVLHIISSFQQF